jgi:Fuc2NAc and GlcNAc transferase
MLMQPHRKHLYQLLVNEMGIEHWKVSVGYGALQLVVGMGALALRGYGDLALIAFLGCCFAGFGVVSSFVRR